MLLFIDTKRHIISPFSHTLAHKLGYVKRIRLMFTKNNMLRVKKTATDIYITTFAKDAMTLLIRDETSVNLSTLLEGNTNQDNIVDLDDYAIL